jgi:acetylornithine deacetylase/succinyl-diaminopimelate desuccinylase-like protein
MSVSSDDAACLAHFQEFIQIPSVSGEGPHNGFYQKAAEWLVARCQEIDGMTVKVVTQTLLA